VVRYIGIDVHREFAEVAVLEDGVARSGGRVPATPEGIRLLADSLAPDDVVAIEATVNTYAVARLLEERVGRVVISNPIKTRAIAEAKVKTDQIDARVLAQLLAAGFLPEVWRPCEELQALRRLVAQRTRIVRERTRLKNQVQAVLHRNLIPRCPAADLFGRKGRGWLAEQDLPADEQILVASALRRLDVAGEELGLVERELAGRTLQSPDALRLMTIPGVDMVVAISLVAAIGEVTRFASSRKLVSYLGLDPRVRQSGSQPAHHGRISKQGRAQARGMLVEAAWACAKTPGPLRAFFLRVRGRRGEQVAAVATARKLAVVCWQMLTRGEDYAYARPSLIAQKRRTLELKAGAPPRRGQRGSTYRYNLREIREAERAMSLQAEVAYEKLTARWTKSGPKAAGAGAARGVRLQ
jgi:transposase